MHHEKRLDVFAEKSVNVSYRLQRKRTGSPKRGKMMMKDSVLKQIADLNNLSHAQLVELWRTLNGKDAPAFNRPFLIKRISYRIQELAYGGLPQTAHKQMDDILDTHGFDEIGRNPATQQRTRKQKDGLPVAGTRLVREWSGRSYEVIVLHDGFEYGGRKYRSLTAITKDITGTHWNGRMFFGLKKSTKRKGDAKK